MDAVTPNDTTVYRIPIQSYIANRYTKMDELLLDNTTSSIINNIPDGNMSSHLPGVPNVNPGRSLIERFQMNCDMIKNKQLVSVLFEY